ncbi:unnamed protein product [Haemonchus placei]|uniref:Mediator of RNA polymerase II transcription subunit 6 n=1 Tax=Haemonchus placei TaxID=6290 RepID=A0A0N4WUM6_HAEPC|nr:unnamed protein product [Haemonchus placei]
MENGQNLPQDNSQKPAIDYSEYYKYLLENPWVQQFAARFSTASFISVRHADKSEASEKLTEMRFVYGIFFGNIVGSEEYVQILSTAQVVVHVFRLFLYFYTVISIFLSVCALPPPTHCGAVDDSRVT